MADKSFGVKELNLLNASGTPTVTSPNNLNLNANTVAISTSCTIGNNLTVTSTTNSANLNVTGIGTLTRGFATDLSVSGISTISQPSNANPHSLWDVVNNGASAYRFTGPGQDGAEDNPNIYLVRGQRYIFKVNASGHPFQLRVANGGAAYSDGVTNNGAQSGNVVINVQHDAPPQLFYQCTSHGSMVGNIYVVGGPQVISGILTATAIKLPNYTGSNSGSLQLGESPSSNIVMGHQSGNGFIDNNQGELRFYSDTNILLSPDDDVNVGTGITFNANGQITLHNLSSSGVGTFGGGVTVGYDTTYSPIQQAANTYFYTRADQAGSVSGSNIQNLATGSLKISETIPISNMTRQSDAGAHSFYNSSATSGSVSRNMTAANPFAPRSYGLTMGTMFYPHTSGNNGSGVIHYGGTPTSQHFFVRYQYNSVGLNVGADTDGSDNWSIAFHSNLVSDSNWYFFVVAIERNGTLLASLNGSPLTPIRMLGTAPNPGDAVFGLAGDPYTDNDSRHRYATAFWYRGVMSSELIAQEYAWLKTIWTGASLP